MSKMVGDQVTVLALPDRRHPHTKVWHVTVRHGDVVRDQELRQFAEAEVDAMLAFVGALLPAGWTLEPLAGYHSLAFRGVKVSA